MWYSRTGKYIGSSGAYHRVKGREGSCTWGEFGVGAVSARCGLRSETRAGAGHSNTCSRSPAPGATHSTREHKHAGPRGQGTRTMRGPDSLRAIQVACQLTSACHTGARPHPAIQRSQQDSTCKQIPIKIQRARPNPHHARALYQPRAQSPMQQAQAPPRLGYQLANNTLTILDDHFELVRSFSHFLLFSSVQFLIIYFNVRLGPDIDSFSHFLFLRHRIMCWPGPLPKG